MKSANKKRAQLVFILVFFACAIHVFAQPAQQDRKVNTFNSIVLETSDHTRIYIRSNQSPGVKIKADQKLIGKIKSSVLNNVLTIEMDSDDIGDSKVEIYIDAPQLGKITMAGGGYVEILDSFSGDTFQTDLAGGGSIQFMREANINSMKGSVAGGGTIDALKLSVSDASIAVAGGGEVLVHVNARLQGTIAGGGIIRYEGDPEVSSSIVGGGSVSRR